KALFVRVNGLDTPYTLADLAAVVSGKPDGVMLPKSSCGDDVRRLALHLAELEVRESVERGSIRILPIVTETAASMFGLGTYAKAAIHPAQCDVINEAFTPSAKDIEWAKQVVAAFDAAGDTGVASIEGKMLDRPHLRGARRVLERAGLP